jgi:cephalosporin hydroxylase
MTTLEHIIHKYDLPSRQAIIDISQAGRNDLASLLHELDFKSGVEIGIQRGIFSEIICQRNPQMRVYGVDAWAPPNGASMRQKAQKRMSVSRWMAHYSIIDDWSVSASRQFTDQSLDFVYIDAEHSYESCLADINAWHPKIRIGGILSGHDYHNTIPHSRVQCHVKEAIHQYTRDHQIAPLLIWGRGLDTFTSWSFVV